MWQQHFHVIVLSLCVVARRGMRLVWGIYVADGNFSTIIFASGRRGVRICVAHNMHNVITPKRNCKNLHSSAWRMTTAARRRATET